METMVKQCLLALLAVGTVVGPTKATVVGIAFAGVLDQVESGLPFSDSISAGTLFHGTYSYDSNAPDTVPNDPTAGGYYFPDHTLSVAIGSWSFTTPDLGISILHYSSFSSYDVGNASDFVAYGLEWRSMAIFLTDGTGTALGSDALPPGAPDLSDFASGRDFALRQVGHRDPSVRGIITSLVEVPEPSGLVLLALGSVLFAYRRRSRGRSAANGS